LNNLAIPLPPQTEAEYIVQEVERRLSVVDKLEATVEANLKQAGALRQSILKRAFSGELVPQNPDDEPASVLLERIRQERQAAKPKARKGRNSNARPTKSNHAEQRGLF
jgi:type I restriction enzyme S subunit